MGDMKTPDFDDLLAAFDIPDIDAKEAIQSSPEESTVREVKGGDRIRETGSPSTSSSCSPTSHGEPPVVSVIVKNRVQPESYGEAKIERDDTISPTGSGSVPEGLGKLDGVLLASQLNSQVPDISLQQQMRNGFQKPVARAKVEANGELWSHQSTLSTAVSAGESGSERKNTHVMNRLKPLSPPQTSTSTIMSAGPFISFSSASASSPDNQNLISHNSSQIEVTSHPPVMPSPSPSLNGTARAGTQHIVDTEEEDSEPDLGSPLVIQESPTSHNFSLPKPPEESYDPLSSPQSSLGPLSCPPSLSSALSQSKPKLQPKEGVPPTSSSTCPTLKPQDPQNLPSTSHTVFSSVQEEKYPEHVIDEQESPESPPPDQTGFAITKISPGIAPAPASRHEESNNTKESTQSGLSKESKSEEGLQCEKNEVLNAAVTNNSGDNLSSSVEATSPNLAGTISSPSRPLKVKIKTVKTPTGTITRTVTRVAPKCAGVLTKGGDNSRPSPGGRKILNRPKRIVSQKLHEETLTSSGLMPTISPFQDASTAMLVAASKVQNNQGCSRPASIVSSAGAIISKSQSNLVEAFNKILNSKNLLPSYKPDLSLPVPAEWGLPLPTQGYRCLECGDAFALERSLARHYDRRSLRIEVTCNHCAKRLAFFNKCSLLLHAREHKERGLVMQCSHLVMRPVAVEHMICQPEPTLPVSSSTALTLSTSSPTSQPHQPVSSKMAEAVQYTQNRCPECQIQFSNRAEVAAHFQEIKPTHTTSCTECSPPMLLPNGCSSAAHQRIHKACSPHVCPECGGTAKQPAFRTHLDEICLHFARRIGYRCSSCQVVFGGLNSVKSHTEAAHCDMFHKCPSCPMAFKSAPSAQSHIVSQHSTLTGGQAKIIYKCVMCDTVFTQKSMLYSHFDTHLAKQKVNVFKCPDCTKLYSQRTSLMDHIKSAHRGQPTVKQEMAQSSASSARSRPSIKMESSDGEEWKEPEEEGDGERAKSSSEWSCKPCHARYTGREDYISHMAEQHGKVLKKFPCNKCESSFTSTSSLRRHIRIKHKGIQRGFLCQFCPEGEKAFSSRVMLERHLQLRHSVDAVSQKTTLKGGSGFEDADSSSEQDAGSGPAQGSRRAPTEARMDAVDGPSPAKKTKVTPSSLPASGFRCAPCGFSTEDRAAFLEHIPQHRSEGAAGLSLQCLQCGACFTSAPSLSRHLFITHRVRDTPLDNSRNREHPAASPGNSGCHDDQGSVPGSPPSNHSTLQKEEGENKLTCKVCGKHFDKPTDLNTHFRTHGMAFISARNAGKST